MGKYCQFGFIQKFDRKNIDRQSLRQPVFVMQLENIEREILTDHWLNVKSISIPQSKFYALRQLLILS